jgi:hypothetical protein
VISGFLGDCSSSVLGGVASRELFSFKDKKRENLIYLKVQLNTSWMEAFILRSGRISFFSPPISLFLNQKLYLLAQYTDRKLERQNL